MAEDTGQTRSEAPTQHRREEARRQGQVAVSGELSSGLLLLTGVAGLWLGGQALGSGLLDAIRQTLLGVRPFDLGVGQAHQLVLGLVNQAVGLLGYFLGLLMTVGIGIGVLQVGFQISTEVALPNWERLSPLTGWNRLFSAASGVRGVMAVLKVSVIAALAVWILRGRFSQIAAPHLDGLSGTVGAAWDLAMRLALAIAAGLVVIGVADYGFQRWRFEQSLMMSRQEVKEEMKREEGDPLLRARIRKLQREAGRKRMLADVPKANVVITNPTHLAIALRYDRGTMPAPKVLAKGAGALAQRIVDVARRHAVPVVERKPVAQALYKAVQVGQEIPAALYYAVAEVLAYVYRLRGS